MFFSRQDDHPGVSKEQRAIAAEKGKKRRRFLLERKFIIAGSKMQGSCRCQDWQAATRHLDVKKTPRPLSYLAQMDRIKDKVQINIPFTMLWDSYVDRFIELGLHPEIGLDANTFVRFTRSDFETVAQRLNRRSLTTTLHAPFVDLSAGSLDPDIRALTRRRFEQVLGIVPIFRPKTVVCHFGYDWKRYDYFKAEWIENSLEIWSWFGERVGDADSQLMIENVYERSPDDMQIVFEHLEDQNVGFCLDTGHQAAFSRAPLVKWLDTLGPYLRQLHLHDNTGQADDHLAMGQGGIDFKTLFRSLKALRKHPPVITLEPHREKDLWPSLAYLEKIWPW